MDATVEPILTFKPREDGWITRLFDWKPFLAVLCMLPAAGLLLVFLTYPLGLGVWLAFTDTTIGQPGQWIGLDNFISLANDSVFWLAVTNTIFYTASATVGKFALGLWLALLLNHHIPFKAFIRAILLLPWIVPTVLSAIAWWWIYDPQFSIISFVVVNVLHLQKNYIDFLGTPWHARWSLVVANIWRGIPFVAITLLAGLQTISPSLYEAALLDGANGWQRFRRITVPMLMPILAVVLTLSILFTFSDFQLVVCDHPRRPVQHHPPDGNAGVPARHPRLGTGRGCGHRGRHDPVPGGGDAGEFLRPRPTQVDAGRSQ